MGLGAMRTQSNWARRVSLVGRNPRSAWVDEMRRVARAVRPRRSATEADATAHLSDRSDYKRTWTALATTDNDAAMWVAGTADDQHLETTGAHTVELLMRYVAIEPTDEVLEIGCGVGRVGKVLAPRCRSWVGADISPNMLVVARRRLAGLANVEFCELATVGLSEFADESFDVVYCTVVFMHLFEWDRYRYVQEAHRVLRPGGRCFFDNVDITSGHARSFFAEGASYPLMDRPAQIGMASSGDELRVYGGWAGFAEIRIYRWDDAWVGMVGTKIPPPEKPPDAEHVDSPQSAT